MELTKEIEEQADFIAYLSVEEARELPGMLGAIAAPMLEAQGWYSYTQCGEKVLIIRHELDDVDLNPANILGIVEDAPEHIPARLS